MELETSDFNGSDEEFNICDIGTSRDKKGFYVFIDDGSGGNR